MNINEKAAEHVASAAFITLMVSVMQLSKYENIKTKNDRATVCEVIELDNSNLK